MFDTSAALADMANQVRLCRSADGLTLQQLAARSGVAASTIHKVESQQMVPTVTVLLKISKGLGRRPQDLIRDTPGDVLEEVGGKRGVAGHAAEPARRVNVDGRGQGAAGQSDGRVRSRADREVGVWHLEVSPPKILPTLDLHSHQRAILLVERGALELQAGDRRIHMALGDCIEVIGVRIQSRAAGPESAWLTLIVSPPGNLAHHLGDSTASAPARSRSASAHR